MTFTVAQSAPWLVACFEAKQQMLSWSLNRPGYCRADSVAWLEVKNKDLPEGLDPKQMLKARLADAGMAGAVGMMTSRSVAHYHIGQGRSPSTSVRCLMTLGLSNGAHIGHPCDQKAEISVGTINMLCHVASPLSEAAMLETLSLATQARTAALMEVGPMMAESNLRVTGTGTDCMVIACPSRPWGEAFAGMHTDIGQLVGRVVYETTLSASKQWMQEQGAVI